MCMYTVRRCLVAKAENLGLAVKTTLAAVAASSIMTSVPSADRPVPEKVRATLLYREWKDNENDMVWLAMAFSGCWQGRERTNSVTNWTSLIGL